MCSNCAQEIGAEQETPAFAPTVGELLGSITGDTGSRSCPSCGTRFKRIRTTGQVGCAECFRVFHSRIEHLLAHAGLSEAHVGRYPTRLASYKRLLIDRETLRHELNSAITREDYEQAADLRDRIKSLEEQQDETA